MNEKLWDVLANRIKEDGYSRSHPQNPRTFKQLKINDVHLDIYDDNKTIYKNIVDNTVSYQNVWTRGYTCPLSFEEFFISGQPYLKHKFEDIFSYIKDNGTSKFIPAHEWMKSDFTQFAAKINGKVVHACIMTTSEEPVRYIRSFNPEEVFIWDSNEPMPCWIKRMLNIGVDDSWMDTFEV